MKTRLPSRPRSSRYGDTGQLRFASPRSMANFTKNENCPSSQKLLDYQRSKLAETTTAKIQRHLAKCEFCSAESHFYAQFPLDEEAQETTTATSIPAPLYELAEALLKNRHFNSSSLNSLLKRKKPASR